MAQEQIIEKIVVIGNEKVGKTCLTASLVDKQLPENYKPTIGMDFAWKTLEQEELELRLQVWDTAGGERFYGITNSYFRGAHVILIAVNPASIRDGNHQLERHIGRVAQCASPDTKILYVVTQWDLADDWNVTEDDCREAIKAASGSQATDKDIFFYSSTEPKPEQKKALLDAIVSAAPKPDKKLGRLDSVPQNSPDPHSVKQPAAPTTYFTGLRMFGFLVLFAALATAFLALGGVTGGVEQIWSNIGEFFNAIKLAVDFGPGALLTDWGIGVLVASILLAAAVTGGSMLIDYYRKAGDEPDSEDSDQKKGRYSEISPGGTELKNITEVYKGPFGPQAELTDDTPHAQKKSSTCTLF